MILLNQTVMLRKWIMYDALGLNLQLKIGMDVHRLDVLILYVVLCMHVQRVNMEPIQQHHR